VSAIEFLTVKSLAMRVRGSALMTFNLNLVLQLNVAAVKGVHAMSWPNAVRCTLLLLFTVTALVA